MFALERQKLILEMLKNDEYQSKLALAIFDGFMRYYNNQNTD